MNKINIENIIFGDSSNNFYSIKNKRSNKSIKFKLKNVFLPFGLDEEYNNYYLKFELDEHNLEHIEFKNTITLLEKKIMNDFKCSEIEFKNIIKKRENKKDLLACRIKKFKSNISINITYENKENNYLKTIYDINKNIYTDIDIEINSLWDFRNSSKDENNIGLIIYISKIHVYE
jgi:hypothetical protein